MQSLLRKVGDVDPVVWISDGFVDTFFPPDVSGFSPFVPVSFFPSVDDSFFVNFPFFLPVLGEPFLFVLLGIFVSVFFFCGDVCRGVISGDAFAGGTPFPEGTPFFVSPAIVDDQEIAQEPQRSIPIR